MCSAIRLYNGNSDQAQDRTFTLATCSVTPKIRACLLLRKALNSDVSQWKEVFDMCPLPIYAVHCNTLEQMELKI